MRKISAANSVASSPPVPARISSTTFFSSLGSLGSSRTLSSSSICASSGSSAPLPPRPWRAGRGRAPAAWRAPAPARPATFFHSRYLATTSESSLCALVTLRYCVGVADHGGIGHLPVQLVEALFELFEFLSELHGGFHAMTSSPPCDFSSAMAPSSAWMATAACSSDGGLVVMRCSPQAGRGERGQERAAAVWRRSGSARSSGRRSPAAARCAQSNLAAKSSNGISV